MEALRAYLVCTEQIPWWLHLLDTTFTIVTYELVSWAVRATISTLTKKDKKP